MDKTITAGSRQETLDLIKALNKHIDTYGAKPLAIEVNSKRYDSYDIEEAIQISKE